MMLHKQVPFKQFELCFAGHDGGQVVLWRLDTSSHLLLGPSHANAVCCLAPALTAKGDELLLSGSYDGCVSLWEPRHLRGVKPHLLARWAGCAESVRLRGCCMVLYELFTMYRGCNPKALPTCFVTFC